MPFFNVFGMTRPLAGIEPGTPCTGSEHSITRLLRWCSRDSNGHILTAVRARVVDTVSDRSEKKSGE